MGIGRGFGKLLLFGEHSAVYGYPALGVRLDWSLEVVVTDSPEWEFPAVVTDRYRAALIDTIGTVVGRDHGPFSVTVHGNLPLSVGLGSSAAFCTALLRAIDPVRFADDEVLWRGAHALEHVFHGRPSGIDTGLSVHPGASVFSFKRRADDRGSTTEPGSASTSSEPGRVSPIPQRASIALPHGYLLLCAIPRTASTATLVQRVADCREGDPEGTRAIMEELGKVAERVAHGANGKRPSLGEVGELATRAHRALVRLGVSSVELDEGVRLLEQAGALGAKLSGAGGGGAFYGVFQTHAAAVSAAAAMRSWVESERLTVDGRPIVTIVETGPHL